MTKDKLKEILEAIYSEYQITEYGKEVLDEKNSGIDSYIDCLGHENLGKHLYETGLCPSLNDVSDEIGYYSNAIGIIEKFMESMDALEDQCGFFEMIEQGRFWVALNGAPWPVLKPLELPDNVIDFPKK